MNKITFSVLNIIMFVIIVFPLHAFYIDNAFGNAIHADSVKTAWSKSGVTDGVENISYTGIEYDITTLPTEWVGHAPYNAVNANANATDNAYAFTRAIRIMDSLSTNMKTLKIPQGTYNITGSLQLPPNIIIKGDGSGQTILNFIVPENPTWTAHCLNAFEMIDIDHTGIEDLTIQRFCLPNGGNDLHQYLIAPSHGGMDNSNNIFIRKSDQCWVTGVESIEPLRHHMEIDSCNNITVSGCYFDSARIRSGGGFGYGVQLLNGANQCLIENNIFHHNRHGVVFNDGSHYNVVAYNYIGDSECVSEWNPLGLPTIIIRSSYGDISLHGQNDEEGFPLTFQGPYNNLIEGNNCDILAVDTSHKENGVNNVFLRNRLKNDGLHICGEKDLDSHIVSALHDMFLIPSCWPVALAMIFSDLATTCSTCLIAKVNDPDLFADQPKQISINNWLQNNSWWKSQIMGYPYRQHSNHGQYEKVVRMKYIGFWGQWKEKTINDSHDGRQDFTYFRYAIDPDSNNPSYFKDEDWPYGPQSNINPAKRRWDSGGAIKTFSRTDPPGGKFVITTDSTFTGNLVVDAGTSLSLRPGVILKFTSGHGIIVNGGLEAIGTPAQPITFTNSDSVNIRLQGFIPNTVWDGMHVSGNAGSKPIITLSNCKFSHATDCALKLEHYEEATLDSCLFENNTGMGAISADDGNLVLTNTTFTDNTRSGEDYGGAALTLKSTIADIENCSFSENESHVKAGAIQITGTEGDSSTVNLTNCYFSNNFSEASSYAGCAINAEDYNGPINVVNCSFINQRKAIHSTLTQNMFISNSLFNNTKDPNDNLVIPNNTSTGYKYILESNYFALLNLGTISPVVTILDTIYTGNAGIILNEDEEQTGLFQTSKLVNTGNKDANLAALDILGHPRTIGRNIDIGAFETLKAEIRIDTLAVDFGDTPVVSDPSFAVKEYSLRIYNLGTYDLNLDSLSVPAGYTVETTSLVIPSAYIYHENVDTTSYEHDPDSNSSSYITLKIKFYPVNHKIDYQNKMITFTTNDSLNQHIAISVNGIGRAAQLSASCDTLQLADFPANNTPSFGDEYIKVWNSGNIPLVIDSLTAPKQFQYAITTVSPPGKSVISNKDINYHRGRAQQDFSSKRISEDSSVRLPALKPVSKIQKTKSNPSKSGSDLTWLNSGSLVLNPNDTVCVKVRYKPYEIKKYAGNLRFITNDSYQAIHEIYIEGHGDTLVVSKNPIPPEVSGNITSDTLWVCPEIQVMDSVKVANGKTLTISPFHRSIKIKTEPHIGFIVEGNLHVTNLADSIVTFTAVDPNAGWWGIQFRNNLYGSSNFNHTILEYGTSNLRPITSGGIISAHDYGILSLNYCSLRHNHATGNGGAISTQNSVISVNHCAFTNNSAMNGGALSYTAIANSQSQISYSSFSDNTSTKSGGALFLTGIGEISLYTDTFNQNLSAKGGAIEFYEKANRSLITNCTFTENNASLKGGAINAEKSSFTLNSNNHFNANHSYISGGAVNAEKCQVSSENDIYSDNYSAIGGAFALNSCEYLVRNSTLSENSASSNGGGICVSDSSTMIYTSPDTLVCEKNIHSNVIKTNFAIGNGGGIYISETCDFHGNALEDNEAANGGGAYIIAGNIAFDSNTVAGNIAEHGCGLFIEDNAINMTNTLIWENGSETDKPIFLEHASQVNLTNCNIPPLGFEGTPASITKINCLSIDPQFEKHFSTNCFPAYALSKVSKCVNAGLPGTFVPSGETDANNSLRITDQHGTEIIDIGAYEFQFIRLHCCLMTIYQFLLIHQQQRVN